MVYGSMTFCYGADCMGFLWAIKHITKVESPTGRVFIWGLLVWLFLSVCYAVADLLYQVISHLSTGLPYSG